MKVIHWIAIIISLVALFTIVPAPAYSQRQDMPFTQAVPGASSAPLAAAPGGPGYLMIHASGFRPSTNDLQYISGLVIQTLPTSPVTAYRYTAPVELPQGATIKQVTLYFRDNDPAQFISVTLWQMGMPSSSASGLATVNSPVAGTTGDTFVQKTLTSSPVVDNQANAYYLDLTLPPNPVINTIFVTGVRIDFQYSGFLPAVTR
jgi:hypothetical protein